MSVAPPEIPLTPSQHNTAYDVHRVVSKDPSKTSITRVFSTGRISQDSGYNDGATTSQETNTLSSIAGSQDTSVSSQEVVQVIGEQSFTRTITPGMTTEETAREDTTTRNHPDMKSANGIHQQLIPTPNDSTATVGPQRPLSAYVPRIDTAAGQKRMANGEIKHSSSTSPVNHLGVELSQLANISPQRSPQIGQLAGKLKTKLNYAMVKVQNGWESKSINELEAITAKASPRPRSSNASQSAISPQRKLAGSPPRPGTRDRHSPNIVAGGKRSPDSMSSSSSISDIAYIRNAPILSQTKQPSLAPPVDLGPKNPRRSNPGTFVPPTMEARLSSDMTLSSGSSARPQFATPPTTQRPMSQLADKPSSVMEQDAIETLLFMSSPSNTQYRPNSQQTTASWLLSGSQPRKSNLSGPTALARVLNTDAIPISPPKKRQLDGMNFGNDHDIDQVLEMPMDQEDIESSSDEDEIL